MLKTAWIASMLLAGCACLRLSAQAPADSLYTERPNDPQAVLFTPPAADPKGGPSDVTDALQRTIDELKMKESFGIILVPEGTYQLSRTIEIPKAIRLIGYGTHRPTFVLRDQAPGFQQPGGRRQGPYLFWFTSEPRQEGKASSDANAGTFYSAFSNINVSLGHGNPAAIAFRTHYAQHSFLSHVDIDIGEGFAGIDDVGNYMQAVRFFGGEYGIRTTKCSPGWQFVMLDTHFEGQRRAAIRTQEAGLTIIRMTASHVPAAIEVDPGYWEKLYMEDCRLVDISGPALLVDSSTNAHTQVNLADVSCDRVPVLLKFRDSGREIAGKGPAYQVSRLSSGLQFANPGAEGSVGLLSEISPLASAAAPTVSDLPALPAMKEWASVRDFGAKGDGETDDTAAIQAAIKASRTVFVPQGWYRVSDTLRLRPDTALIGLSPISTQFILRDNTPAFGGFGEPRALVEAPAGGAVIMTGIGLCTGDYNARAVACKWMSGPRSWMNDVKFLGGHGDMERGPYKPWSWHRPNTASRETRIRPGFDPAWDTQHWSLWVTNGGGGRFTDLWSANTFATNGAYISDTTTEGRIYALSVEHHVRNEVRFRNVSNWKAYGLQLEEESRESSQCQPLEIENCSNLTFANLYSFRVIRVNTPWPCAIRTWNCAGVEFLGVHNYAQTKYPNTDALHDVGSGARVKVPEFARLLVGKAPAPQPAAKGEAQRLAEGFLYANGACSDSRGNVYFCDTEWKRVYRWSASSQALSLVADFPWDPLSLACDTDDRLIVVFKYQPQPGFIRPDGKPDVFVNPPDADGTSFSGWGNSGFGVFAYSIDPERPESTIQRLRTAPMGSVASPARVLFPSNRWRDTHDHDRIVLARPSECLVGLDGRTIIPVCYDLARANSLVSAPAGGELYVTDEYDKRIVRLAVDARGYATAASHFAEKGEFHSVRSADGTLYVADGDIHVFDSQGRETGLLRMPEHALTLALGDADGASLYVTTHTALWRIRLR